MCQKQLFSITISGAWFGGLSVWSEGCGVLVSFSFGRYPRWNLKVSSVGLLLWMFLGEEGYRSCVAAVGFCAVGRPVDWVWGSCTFGRSCSLLKTLDWGGHCFWLIEFGGGSSLAEGTCGQGFSEMLLLLPSALWFFTLWCFWGLCRGAQKQTITPLNDLSIAFNPIQARLFYRSKVWGGSLGTPSL